MRYLFPYVLFERVNVVHDIIDMTRHIHKFSSTRNDQRRAHIDINMLYRTILITVTICCHVFVSVISLVSATNEVLFIFNNGFTSSYGAKCEKDWEIEKIDAVFRNRRLLRWNNSTHLESLPEASLRELLTYSRKCKNLCAKYAPRTCRVKGCLGFRNLATNEEDRSLQDSCSTEINLLHAKLDKVMSQVTANCKSFLDRNKRRATCYPDFVYGNIEGIRVWRVSGTKQYLVTSMVNPGETTSFCSSLFVNIEVLLEPCIEHVHFEMPGPNGYNRSHNEEEAPMALFGDDGTILKGRYLKNGTYTLTVTPDHDNSKDKVFTIVVNNC